ncbi:GNAT family N-acetyltransferase [Alloactinosynnema sp. L-07]|uniref:GNAT family N-acetyltransferase n=1 Tax=Alloactinosynnema sp. L-07 TaxID=1653480 RepID=UPI0006B60701|nr:GNAT family N-acetyltransferase [Alloactinosynnema sp. L-07]
MPELQRLRADHGPALLAFERENRAYFAESVPDRGDDYFAHFDQRHAELLSEQAAGLHHFYLLVDSDGRVQGRVNLVDVADGAAELGFRIARSAVGRGVATSAVRRICDLAARELGLTLLRAGAALDNHASQAVLTRTGFVRTGQEVTADGRPGTTFAKRLEV